MMKNIRKIINEGVKETTMMQEAFDRDYKNVADRIHKYKLEMQERSKDRSLIRNKQL